MKKHYMLLGAGLYGCVLSLYQDIRFGTAERYADKILNGGWVDRSITIPLAIVWIAVTACLIYNDRESK